jgi:hypothetical protein
MYTVKGTVKELGNKETIKQRDGDKVWTKRQVVITTDAERNPELAFTAFGKVFEQTEGMRVGQVVSVAFAPSSRSYKDKWYTELNASEFKILQDVPTTASPAQAFVESDDLPF